MDRTTLRHSLVGALLFGGAVGLLSSVQAYRAGAAFPDVLQPLAFFAFLAATIGALTGPLVGGVLGRMGEERRGDGGPARPAREDPTP